jgi:phytoene dehydrogenase-like protein
MIRTSPFHKADGRVQRDGALGALFEHPCGVRPAPGWSQYATPIDGYDQCGSGTHPGGCVMGAPGKLAAQRILKDRAKRPART